MFYLHERVYIIVNTWWQEWWSLLYYFLIKLHRCFLVLMQNSLPLRVNQSQTLHQRCVDNLSNNWANLSSAKLVHCILCTLSSAYHYLDTTIKEDFIEWITTWDFLVSSKFCEIRFLASKFSMWHGQGQTASLGGGFRISSFLLLSQ